MLEQEIQSEMLKEIYRTTKIRPPLEPGLQLFDYLLTPENIDKVLAAALERGGDFAEIYAEFSFINGISLEESRIRKAEAGISQGVGIRVVRGEKTGYAFSEKFELKEAVAAARTASFISASSGKVGNKAFKISPHSSVTIGLIESYPDTVESGAKAEMLWRANDTAFRKDKRVYQVEASIRDGAKLVAVANSDGVFTGEQRIMTRFTVSAYASNGKSRQVGRHGGGGRVGFEHFSKNSPESFAEEAVRQALIMLGARDAPAGPQTVVLGNGWAGVLLHEAVGHGLEADFNRKGTSLYSGKIGEKVASELCTVVDDGTLPGLRGSTSIDDEGHPSRRNVLIEEGILKGYLADQLNARLMKILSTGSGRRESYKHFPVPRMTNTFMLPGEHTPEEIISSVKRGLYAKSFGGGQVDISNGRFVFQVTEGYVIENGKITYPVKGANLIGSGPEVLQKVVMVGNDLEYDPGVGTCGKEGQSVAVGVGLPTCKVSEITVGGTDVPVRSMMARGV